MAGNQNSGQRGIDRDPNRTCRAKGCNAWPIRGGTVCRGHGGSTEHVKRKASERAAMQDALDLIYELAGAAYMCEGLVPTKWLKENA